MMKKIAGILSLLLCTVLLPGLQVKAAPSENTRYVTLSSSEHSVEVDKDNAMVQYMNLNYGQVVQEGEKFYLRLEFAAKRYNIKNDKPGAPTDLLSGLEYKNGEYFVDVTESFQDENREVFYSSSKLSGDRYLKIYSARIPLDITSFEEAGNTSIRIKATVSAEDYETTLHLEEVTEEKPEITPVFWPYNYYKTSDGLFGPQPGASNKNRLLNYYIQYPCTEYGGITWYYSTAGDEEITEDTDSSSTNSFMVTADSNRQEAYTETVRVRGRVKTADGNGQWLEETSLEVPFSKAGISGVSDEETGIEVVGYNNTIPYDTVLTVSKISDSERMQEAASLLKEEAGDQFGDFRLYDINLSDPDGNAIVLLNPTGEWGEGIYSIDSFGSTVKKNIVFNLDEEDEEEGYYPSNCKIYYLNNGKIEELYTYPTSNAMGNIIGTYEENRDPSGTYILMRTPLTNLEEDMEAGNYKVPVEFVTPQTDDDGTPVDQWFSKTSMLDSYIGGNGLAVISVKESGKKEIYLTLESENDRYISNIRYNGQTLQSVEKYMDVEGNYPKTVCLSLTDKDKNEAYIELQVKVQGESGWQDVILAVNYSDVYSYEQGVVLTAPRITTSTGATAFINEDNAEISIQCDAVDGQIYYTTDGTEPTESKEHLYTEPFTLKTDKEDGQIYNIKAISVKDGYTTSNVASLEIEFKAKGELAETVQVPVIDARYDYAFEENGVTAETGYYNVRLSTATEEAKIYYTVDGSEPTENSNRYEGEFRVPALTDGEPTVIQAYAVREGYNASPTSSYTISFSTSWWDNMREGDSYQVPVDMINIGIWRNQGIKVDSMGAGAIAGDATVYVRDGKKYLSVPLQGMSVANLPGRLTHMWYWENNDNNTGDQAAAFSSSNMGDAKEVSYTYNDDDTIATAIVPLFSEFEQVYAGIESNVSLMGKQGTILWLDYSNTIQQITGEEQATEAITETPVINYTYNEENDSYEIEITAEENAVVEYSVSAQEGDFNWQRYTDKFTVTGEDEQVKDGIVNISARAKTDGKEESQVALQKLTFKKFGQETTLEDGTYQVPVTLMQAYKDEPSMGAGALEGTALVTIKEGTSSIQLTFKGVSIDVDGTGEKYGHLQQLWSYKEGSTVKDLTEANRSEVKVIQTYEDTDLAGGTSTFPQIFELNRSTAEEETIYVRVKVDAMGDVQQDARLVFDYTKAVKAEESEKIPAGNYIVPVQMRKWGSDTELSMGNAGMESSAVLVVSEDGTAVLELGFHALQNSSLTGYLGWLKKVISVEEENQYGYPVKYTTEDAVVLEEWDGVYDNYNDPQAGTDSQMKGRLYPKTVSIPVKVTANADSELGFETENSILIQVYVPVMEAINKGSGTQFAYLDLKWDEYTPVSPDVDRSSLQEMINQAQEKLDDAAVNADKYDPETVAALQKAVADALAVLQNPEADQTAVDEQTELVKTALEGVKLNLNPDILSKLIQEAQALDENLYTPASYQKLTEQIEAALALLEKEDLTQEQIEAQLTALNAAVEGLIEKADKTKLQAKYDEAAAIENNNYPGWEALQAALVSVKKVLEDPNVSQTDVDGQLTLLQNALDNLYGSVDKSELQNLVEQADAMDTSGYAEETTALFEAAVASAKNILSNGAASQTDVDKHIQLLEKTSASLIKAEEEGVVYDGIYTIDGAIMHASNDNQTSMGNAALKKPMQIIMKDGQPTLRMEFGPLTTTGLTGYLGELYYFPDYTDAELPDASQEKVSVNVESVYEEVYDSYNDPETGTDATMKGKEYPHFVTMPVNFDYSQFWVEVYVPVMESISAGSGRQYAKLTLDWSTLTQVSGVETDKKDLQAQISALEKLKEQLGDKNPQEGALTAADFTQEELNVLEAAIVAGKYVDNSLNVGQSAVDAMTESLTAVYHLFSQEAVEVDKSELAKAIEVADTYLNRDDVVYTEATRQILQAARDEAARVYEDEEATQTQVNRCVRAIDEAIQGLEIVGAVKTDLKTALENAYACLNDADSYTAAALETLRTLYDEALTVYENENASQEEVDAQVRILTYAVNNLKRVDEVAVNRQGLHEMIVAASNMAGREHLYTAESIKALKVAIKAAEAVYNDEEATQEEINAQARWPWPCWIWKERPLW